MMALSVEKRCFVTYSLSWEVAYWKYDIVHAGEKLQILLLIIIIIIKTVFNATHVIHGSEESQSRQVQTTESWAFF
jgi:hypothetical protein